MLLHEKIQMLFHITDVKGKELARYASVDPTTISRIKTGKLIPKQTSITIQKLIDGIILYAKENEKLPELYRILHENGISAEEANLSTRLISWLYLDVEFPEKTILAEKLTTPPRTSENPYFSGISPHFGHSSSISPFFHFGTKLNKLMQLTKLSNIRLGQMVNLDPAHISRFRNGHRTPKSNPAIAFRICTTVMDEAYEQGCEEALADLIEVSPATVKNKELLYLHLVNWLCGYEPEHGSIPIRQFLQNMDALSQIHTDALPTLSEIMTEDVLNDASHCYIGNDGLQKAVIRFLVSAIKSDTKELFLYSDQKMDWLITPEDFLMKWMTLMISCIKKGIHIKIIHNIDRNLHEMFEAIKAWMPLYMTGMVEPYYCTAQNGLRFSTTMFFCPGTACIESVFPTDCAADAYYDYHTDSRILNTYEKYKNALLKRSKFLVRMELGRHSGSPDYDSYHDPKNNICITLRKSSVVVSKTNAPYISFVFLHPLMYEAFRAFLEQEEKPANHT